MKKVMILAAVAAMTGGVFADGYNFTATLKTTTGRAGTDAITTLNFGQNAGGVFWYTDAAFTAMPAAYKTTKTISGVVVPALVKTTTKDGNVPAANGTYLIVADGTYANQVATLKTLAAAYNLRSAGQWCETVRVVDLAQCFRIAGTRRINQNFSITGGEAPNDCCTAVGAKMFVNAAGATIDYPTTRATVLPKPANAVPTANLTLFQRFGAQASASANKLEIYAHVFAPLVVEPTKDNLLLPPAFAGWIAGQGTTRQRDSMLISTISGNIVGVIDAPVCVNCCTAPSNSVAFDCANGTVATVLPLSAAYGTFRIAYNRTIP